MVDQPTSIFEGLDRRQEFFELNRLHMALPIRWSTIHLCYNDPHLKAALSLRMLFMNSSSVSSHFFHFGSHVEVLYKLISCGIQAKSFPVNPTGGINIDLYHHWWLSALERHESGIVDGMHMENDEHGKNMIVQHQAIEKLSEYGFDFEIPDKVADMSNRQAGQAPKRTIDELNPSIPEEIKSECDPSPEEAVLEPTRFDVVFGRGKGNQNRPGNARFRVLIDMRMADYEKASKGGKTTIAESVIRIIQESSGRFLKEDAGSNDGGWVEVVDLTEVRSKVSHAFRGRRAAHKKNAQKKSTDTSAAHASTVRGKKSPSPNIFRNM